MSKVRGPKKQLAHSVKRCGSKHPQQIKRIKDMHPQSIERMSATQEEQEEK